jgi:hypothetical protein
MLLAKSIITKETQMSNEKKPQRVDLELRAKASQPLAEEIEKELEEEDKSLASLIEEDNEDATES